MGNTISDAVHLVFTGHQPMTDEEAEKEAKRLYESVHNKQILAQMLQQAESNRFNLQHAKAGIMQVNGTTDPAANIHPKVRQKVKDMFGL